MLSKVENKIMSYIFEQCKDKKTFLISPVDLLKIVDDDKLNLITLENAVKDLSMDGYFDLIYSERHGETVYCITILKKGEGYPREVKVMKRNLVFRLAITVSLAVVSFTVGLILKAIFS